MKTFNTTEFEFSHGFKPRGRGSWAFSPTEFAHLNDDDYIFWAHGCTYTEAKKAARETHPEIDSWVVLP
jgi:hypothetical protein